MVALMSHFPMKEQDFTHFSFFHFFSLYVLSFTMIFLFNWLVCSSFFSYGPSLIWKENATWFSLAFLLFHLPLCTSSALIYLSLSFDASLLAPRSTIFSFRRCAVQSCSKSRVCSCWSSSIFLLRLLDPGVLFCRISQKRRKEDKVEDEGRGQGKRGPVLPQC